MTIDRRLFLSGVIASAAPLRAASPDDAALQALDEAAAEPDPARALLQLRKIDPRRLSRARALDIGAARAGLTIDAALPGAPPAARFALQIPALGRPG